MSNFPLSRNFKLSSLYLKFVRVCSTSHSKIERNIVEKKGKSFIGATRKHKLPKPLSIRSGSPNLHQELKEFVKEINPKLIPKLKNGMTKTLFETSTKGKAKPKRYTYNMVMANLIKGVHNGKLDPISVNIIYLYTIIS